MKALIRNTVVPSFLAITLGSATLICASSASASERRLGTERFSEYADVTDVRPVYQNIRVREPRKECWIESRQQIVGYEQSRLPTPRHERHQAQRNQQRHSSGNAVVGGLIGGVIGNQLGRGHSSGSRAGATIAGAIIGSAIGNESAGEVLRHRREPKVRHERALTRTPIYETVETERCKEVSESRVERTIQHYDVTYRYRGRTFTTRMKRDPGSQIELRVSVAPARH